MINPYQPPQTQELLRGSFEDSAKLLRRGFLYRRIEMQTPFPCVVTYNGWNFLQRIFFNDVLVWKRISWVVIHKRAEFVLPAEVDPECRSGLLELAFGPGLRMRRFVLRIGDRVVYDEQPPGL